MMASKTRAQHFVECDLCQEAVSFFCRRCGVKLCDPCVTIHLRVKSKNGHDIVDFASKVDDYKCHCDSVCSAYCKTCDSPICFNCVSIKHKSHEMSELSDKIEDLLKVIARENDRLQSFKHELERILDHTTKLLSSLSSMYKQRKDEITARGEEWHDLIEKTVKKLHNELNGIQKEHENVLEKQKKEFEELIEKMDEINGKTKKLQKSKNVREMQKFIPVIEKQEVPNELSLYTFPKIYKSEIDENYLQTFFGYVEKMQEKKTPLIEKEFKGLEFLGSKVLEVPTVTSVMDSGFPANEKNKNRLYYMAITDDNKVWIGGHSKELKLFDLQGNLHHTVRIPVLGMYFCMYNKQVVYIDQTNKAVTMISDIDTIAMMFTTGDWRPYGVTSTASGDLLLILRKDNQSKVVRYSSTGTVHQEIQYDSHCQPLYKLPTYITENMNGDIIVTDWEKKEVIAVNRLGIFRYSLSGFTCHTVTTDSIGHVIVTDFRGCKIGMFDRDGRFLRYIIPDGGIIKPRGVCIIGHGEMLVGENLSGIVKSIKYLE